MDIDRDDSAVVQEKVINEEYKIWKKNSPFLYEPEGKPYTLQNIIIGTHTSDEEQNYLQIAQVQSPIADEEGEVEFSVNIVQKINHDGEVNRARYMPSNPNIIATRTRDGPVCIFDCSKHPVAPSNNVVNPEVRLLGHVGEGYGTSWHPRRKGRLITAGEDKTVMEWDIETSGKKKKSAGPINVYKGHDSIVEDVHWSALVDHLFASVGDDRRLLLWDSRYANKGPTKTVDAHEAEVNCVAFSPKNEHLFVTGSADNTVALWDTRNLHHRLHTLEGHQDDILQLAWSPHHETVLASSSADRRLNIWDLSRIGEEQSPEDMEDGPPELLFVHGGHTNKVPDFSWNEGEEWVICSVAEDNVAQVWQMASNIYGNEDPVIDPNDLE
ncbi:Histone-binding protein rbbp4 [Rhizophlyctis rosea]|uniref:Histone-binding protein rbbp4 n=1 Tax=Rhizophlyctis rosea TaxID=64517 RepID=A0AAD5S530_9FUNG|nr:Histone-binding protein rbbp4 [Rhizophlyctis rosea]